MKKNLFQLGWRNAFGTLAVGLGAIASLELPTTAYPIKDSHQLRRESVRSRVSSPIPLNIRPRVHIPLPQSNYSRYPRRSHSQYKHTNYGNRHRSHCHYENCHYHHEHTHQNRHRSHHRRRGKVIIINPGGSTGIGNPIDGNYIRVIRN